ncbi:MAG: DUF5063 domain-containing protein [Burkholderiales bacterium]
MNESHASQVHAFAEIARGFCVWCESTSGAATQGDQTAIWLCRLQAAALSLPEVGFENSDGLPELSADLLAHATTNLAAFNGYYYRECFDPDPMLSDDPVIGDVGDDLLDIYKDLRAGLVLFDCGRATDPLWHWSFLHRVHWGRHAVGAIFALHCLSPSTLK